MTLLRGKNNWKQSDEFQARSHSAYRNNNERALGTRMAEASFGGWSSGKDASATRESVEKIND